MQCSSGSVVYRAASVVVSTAARFERAREGSTPFHTHGSS